MRSLLPLLLLAFPAPLFAAERAVFTDQQDGTTMTVTRADNGDMRIDDSKDGNSGRIVGGTLYMVTHENGADQVMRAEDLTAAVRQSLPSEFRGLFAQLGKGLKPKAMKITPKGDRVIDGRKGKEYEIFGMDGDTSKPMLAVMSEDPALKPYGEAMRRYVGATIAPAAALLGPAIADLANGIDAVFALGAPLKVGDKIMLTRLETVADDARAMALPGTPMTVPQIIASMKAKSARSMQAAPSEEDEAEPAADDTAEVVEVPVTEAESMIVAPPKG